MSSKLIVCVLQNICPSFYFIKFKLIIKMSKTYFMLFFQILALFPFDDIQILGRSVVGVNF